MDFAGGFFTISATDMFLNILLLALTVTLCENGVFADIYRYIYIYIYILHLLYPFLLMDI